MPLDKKSYPIHYFVFYHMHEKNGSNYRKVVPVLCSKFYLIIKYRIGDEINCFSIGFKYISTVFTLHFESVLVVGFFDYFLLGNTN